MSDAVDWQERDSRDGSARAAWPQVAFGIGLVLAEHLLVAGLLGGMGALMVQFEIPENELSVLVATGWFFFIGVSQLVYVVPTFVLSFFWRRPVAAGVALGALATFLLNGACFGALCATTSF